MPYIPLSDRARYDDAISTLVTTLVAQPPEKRKGHANYVITQIVRQAWGVHESGGESYSNYADVIGTLECAKMELYRRGVGPYEDGAIAKNGDL